MPGARITSGERVTLRTVESEDVSFLQRASANPEIRYPLGNPLRNREQIDVSDEKGTDQFLVCLDEDDAGPGRPDEDDVTRIGQVSVSDADWKRPELGYWFVPDVHGGGYGTESVSLVVEYVFREYDTPAVGAGAYDCNDASRGLLESLGFTEEGRRRKFMFVDGEYRDMVQYGLLRREWRERA
ncbi:GNAT family N-acetyltransferase [Halomicrococcus sp. SG-WS-1]|uniref:GNAT family N-acetyltransferase n=1 Tax=Halomicrococcus sp. SG-WS-1 TaxID=3439057 RepID=UPI003F7A7B07